METREQKIERLKSLIEHYKALSNQSVIRVIADKRIKECEQELKELEKGNGEEIIKTKRYKKPDVLYCGSCPHCLHYFEYGDCEQFYCLVDDEYKFNDSAQNEGCPFKKEDK